MKVRLSAITLMSLMALVLGGLGTTIARAADPGELLSRTTVTLVAGQQSTVPIYGSGPGNVRLMVSGGSTGDAIQVSLQGGDSPASWVGRTGETVWGVATFPQANGRLLIQNQSSNTLTATVEAYALDNAPSFAESISTLTGVAQGPGAQSSAIVTAPNSGLYRFTLGANQGSYQLVVDGGVIRKTVVAGAAPSADDTVYFLNAGVHTLTITQNSADATTEWSVALSPVGGTDALPSGENTAVLGGGSFFTEERIPLQIAAAQAVNLRIATTGAGSDSLTIELYNGENLVYSSSPVFGGEVAWGSATLAEGANSLRVKAKDGNAGALGYNVGLSVVAATPLNWDGASYGNPQHAADGRSQIQAIFPANGLYRFTLGASAGRYQFTLGGNYLQKTVTASGVEFTAYVPAGAQALTIIQDPAAPSTVWNVAINPTEQGLDGLPFTTASGTLGGNGNAFREEWIPVQVAAGASVNIRVAANGAASDSLQIEVYNADSKVYTVDKVYGSEVLWANTSLAAGRNLIHVVAPEGNGGQMSYELSLNAVGTIPTSWGGVSRGAGLKSMVTLIAPVSGTYAVTVTVENGAGQIQVDPAAGAGRSRVIRPAGAVSELRVPLTAGTHTFVFTQDADQESTTWSVSASLRKADSVQPANKVIYTPLVFR